MFIEPESKIIKLSVTQLTDFLLCQKRVFFHLQKVDKQIFKWSEDGKKYHEFLQIEKAYKEVPSILHVLHDGWLFIITGKIDFVQETENNLVFYEYKTKTKNIICFEHFLQLYIYLWSAIPISSDKPRIGQLIYINRRENKKYAKNEVSQYDPNLNLLFISSLEKLKEALITQKYEVNKKYCFPCFFRKYCFQPYSSSIS